MQTKYLIKKKCHLATNKTLYKNQFFMIRQSFSENFSDLYHEVCHIYDPANLKRRKDMKHTRTARPANRQQERSASHTS